MSLDKLVGASYIAMVLMSAATLMLSVVQGEEIEYLKRQLESQQQQRQEVSCNTNSDSSWFGFNRKEETSCEYIQ